MKHIIVPFFSFRYPYVKGEFMMSSRPMKRITALCAALFLALFCVSPAGAEALAGGTHSSVATPITTEMIAKPYAVSFPWALETIQYWYSVTPPAAGDIYITAQKTSGYATIYIQIFKGDGAVDEPQTLSGNPSTFTVHAESEIDTVFFCLYCTMPTGTDVSFSVCFGDQHDYNSTAIAVKAATCQEPGMKAVMCTLCSQLGVMEPTPVTDHVADEWTTYTEVTCDTDGAKVQACKYCGEVMGFMSIPSGHTFGKWAITEIPTAEKEGVQTRTCSRCGQTETKSIPVIQ